MNKFEDKSLNCETDLVSQALKQISLLQGLHTNLFVAKHNKERILEEVSRLEFLLADTKAQLDSKRNNLKRVDSHIESLKNSIDDLTCNN